MHSFKILNRGSRRLPTCISFIVIWVCAYLIIIHLELFQPSDTSPNTIDGLVLVEYTDVEQIEVCERMYLSSATGTTGLTKSSVKMFIHDPIHDPWLSGQIAENGVYNRYATKMMFGILDKMLQEGYVTKHI
jgi:hypothetical protein